MSPWVRAVKTLVGITVSARSLRLCAWVTPSVPARAMLEWLEPRTPPAIRPITISVCGARLRPGPTSRPARTPATAAMPKAATKVSRMRGRIEALWSSASSLRRLNTTAVTMKGRITIFNRSM